MLRRLIVLTVLTAGMSAATVITLATPALAKGPTQARITGPGLARPVVIAGGGEPGQLDRLAVLATQTDLYTAMFGAGGSLPAPDRLRTPPPAGALGPRYTIVYTVPGVTPQPGQEFGRIREDLYPRAAGEPVIYIPPGQQGFGQPLLVTGWLRGTPQLVRTLARLGVRPPLGARTARAAGPSAREPESAVTAWLIILAVAVAATALAGAALRRHRRPGAAAPSGPHPAARP
jgi:hypothetical protein